MSVVLFNINDVITKLYKNREHRRCLWSAEMATLHENPVCNLVLDLRTSGPQFPNMDISWKCYSYSCKLIYETTHFTRTLIETLLLPPPSCQGFSYVHRRLHKMQSGSHSSVHVTMTSLLRYRRITKVAVQINYKSEVNKTVARRQKVNTAN